MNIFEKDILENKSGLDSKDFDSEGKEQIQVYFNDARGNEEILFNALKRTIDIIFSVLLLILTAPIILITMILIKVESEGNVFYKQDRLGKNNNIFTIYKLRSMYNDAEVDGAKWARINDTRITRVGAFIRKTRIDELPQLINVLKGEMSIIGPRPEREIFAEKFIMEDENFSYRTLVKPGLTGLAQINGGYELSPFEKLEFDLQYIQERSIKMENKIFISTIRVIFTGDGAR